jgi:putative peptide zinc metalloprotease protein
VAGQVFSGSWYRVASLAPRLRSHARLHRHRYRGETWYVLQDLASDRVYRFSTAGYVVIGLMDGRRTVQEIWDVAADRLGDDAPTQDEMIHLLSQLQSADVLQCDVPPDTAELLRRHQRREVRSLWAKWGSPLSWRFSLANPERFLRATLPLVGPWFGPVGFALWLLVVGTAVVLAAVHWHDLTSGMFDRLLAPQHALLLWACFPVIKTAHELGHAYATKRFGGEVHDLGVMLLVFTPVPYVDASAASAFGSKWQRLTVGAAGMLVELFLASLALFLWLAAEPGLVRTLAYAVIAIAGISTVAFNANPLLRYDGYYMLADLLEIPNLYTRSRNFVRSLVERYLLGRRDLDMPACAPGERAWFVFYAVASFLYRVLVVAAISMFLMATAFYVGVLLAGLGLAMWGVMPVLRGIRYLIVGRELGRARARAVVAVAVLIAAVVGAVTLVPLPFRSRAEGVVWIPSEASVRVETEGFVDRVVARPGSRVRKGEALLVCRDPVIANREMVQAARVRELEARRDQERTADRVRMLIVEEELASARAELARLRERLAGLTIRSGVDGTFVLPLAENLAGRFVKKGELLGYVVELDRIVVRAIVSQAYIDLVRQRRDGVEVRLSERLDQPLPAVVKREIPGATGTLPTAALGTGGGGRVPVDPREPRGTTALDQVFQVDLELPTDVRLLNVGGRVYVRFDHGKAPVVAQVYRELRQVFLSRLLL